MENKKLSYIFVINLNKNSMEKVFIYALTEPDNINEIRYIGKTKNLKRRFIYHITESKREGNFSHKANWIRSLLRKETKPQIIEIDYIPNNEWGFWETYYISLFKSWGFNLTNTAPGGFGYDEYNKKDLTINLLIRKSLNFHRKSIITDEEFEEYLLHKEEKMRRKLLNKCSVDSFKIVTINAKTGELVKEYNTIAATARDLNTRVSKIQEVINHKVYGNGRPRFTYKGLKIIKKVNLTENDLTPIKYKKEGNFNRFIKNFKIITILK